MTATDVELIIEACRFYAEWLEARGKDLLQSKLSNDVSDGKLMRRKSREILGIADAYAELKTYG